MTEVALNADRFKGSFEGGTSVSCKG
jgi:hypothetical protein